MNPMNITNGEVSFKFLLRQSLELDRTSFVTLITAIIMGSIIGFGILITLFCCLFRTCGGTSSTGQLVSAPRVSLNHYLTNRRTPSQGR